MVFQGTYTVFDDSGDEEDIDLIAEAFVGKALDTVTLERVALDKMIVDTEPGQMDADHNSTLETPFDVGNCGIVPRELSFCSHGSISASSSSNVQAEDSNEGVRKVIYRKKPPLAEKHKSSNEPPPAVRHKSPNVGHPSPKLINHYIGCYAPKEVRFESPGRAAKVSDRGVVSPPPLQ